MVPRETENNAYAKFWGDKERALWYIMVFSGVVNNRDFPYFRELHVGVPKCTIKGPDRKEVPCEVLDNGDGTYDCVFTPEEVGRHNIDVLFGGEPVPGSPFNIKAEKPVKPVAVDKIKCEPKVDKEPLVDEELVYAVDARPAESAPGEIPEGLLNGSLLTPSGDKEPVRIKDNNDGTYDVACVPKEPGPHELSLDYDGVPLPGSPYKFDAVEGGADKVKAYGKGIKSLVLPPNPPPPLIFPHTYTPFPNRKEK